MIVNEHVKVVGGAELGAKDIP